MTIGEIREKNREKWTKIRAMERECHEIDTRHNLAKTIGIVIDDMGIRVIVAKEGMIRLTDSDTRWLMGVLNELYGEAK